MGWSALLGLGAAIAGQFAVCLAVGWVIDTAAGTSPIFLLVGLGLGLVAAASYTVVEFRKYLKN